MWRSRGEGRASAGAPGAWNVNWEDCFNKALIFANAGRGLAGGATQAGGQLTARYCQQTWLTQYELSSAKQLRHQWVREILSVGRCLYPTYRKQRDLPWCTMCVCSTISSRDARGLARICWGQNSEYTSQKRTVLLGRITGVAAKHMLAYL